MYKFIMKGKVKIKGEIEAGGSKNACLPLMAASILCNGKIVLRNCPDVDDVKYMKQVLEYLGCEIKFSKNTCEINVPKKTKNIAPYDIVRKMRASYYVLGSLTGKNREAVISLPGGCAIGERPMDLHIKGLKALGCKIKLLHGYIEAKCSKLKGGSVFLEGRNGTSVGATINTIMAAVLAEGGTTIKGAAIEPEVGQIIMFLNMAGADIKGINTPVIEINGVDRLRPVEIHVMPDRIESGTLLAAASITGGEILLKNTNPEDYSAVIDKFIEIGDNVKIENDKVYLKAGKNRKSVNINALPYPHFPTDMQAQFTSVLSTIEGISVVTDNVFQKRFMHIPELKRMGADIELNDNNAIIKGVNKLSGAPVMASDLRASAALVIAGLVAEGETEIKRIYHIDRGYEKIEKKLNKLGAKIKRVKE